jgi:hypothetical protein
MVGDDRGGGGAPGRTWSSDGDVQVPHIGNHM